MSANRTAEVVRETKETQIRVRLDIDGTGKSTMRMFRRSAAGP